MCFIFNLFHVGRGCVKKCRTAYFGHYYAMLEPRPMQNSRIVIGFSLIALTLSACNGASGRSPDLSSQSVAQANAQASAPKTTVQKLNYTFGPFQLSANTASTPMAGKDGQMNFHVDSPVWMTGFEPHLVDAKGNALPKNMVQLVVLSNNREINPLCETRQSGNPFAAATSLMQGVTLPEGFGYPLLPEDTLEAKIVLRNPTDEDVSDVYFTFTLTAEPMDVASYKHDVFPLLLDVDPCDHTPITLPPNGMVEKKSVFAVPEDGRVVKAQGLLQDYGVSVSVAANKDSSKFEWSTTAQLNDAHHIVSLDAYENSKGADVKKSAVMNLGVVYDNFSSAWVNDATAAAMIYVARDSTAPATTLKPSSDGNRTTNQPTITATKAQNILLK